jgi:hypothetical protein
LEELARDLEAPKYQEAGHREQLGEKATPEMARFREEDHREQ